jgi:hypothetical protein
MKISTNYDSCEKCGIVSDLDIINVDDNGYWTCTFCKERNYVSKED